MKRAILFLVAIGLVGACSKSKSGDGTTPDQPETPTILRHIPADTPFVMASPEAPPRALSEWLAQGFAPLADMAQSKMTELRAEMSDPVGKAILAEFDGKLSRAGMESLGFTLEPRFAMYAIGPSLAIRIELADGAKVSALFDRLEQNAGQSLPMANMGGINYRQVTEDDLAMVAAVIDNELVFGVMHANARTLVLPVLFGQTPPERSIADAAIFESYRKKYQLLDFYNGYIDSHAIVDMLTGKSSALSQEIMKASYENFSGYSPECQAEFNQLADAMPRMVFGYQELSADFMRAVVAMEMRQDLASDLVGLQAPVLDLDALSEGRPMFAMGINADVGRVASWFKGKIAEMAATPYRCEYFEGFNEAVAEIRDGMNEPPPPFITGFKGFAMSMRDFEMGSFMPTGSGYAVMAMDDVMGALNVLKGQMPLPLPNIQPDGKPITMPLGMPGLESVDVMATPNRFAIAAGNGMMDKAATLLDGKPGPDAPAMYFAYDYNRILQTMQTGSMGGEEAAIMEAVGSIFGFTSAAIRFTGDGVVMIQTIEPKR